MKNRFFHNNRSLHRWTGSLAAIFILTLSISGLLLMHWEELELDKIEISEQYLPKKYFDVEGAGLSVQTLRSLPGPSPVLLAGTVLGLFRSEDLGLHWSPINEGLFNLDIRSIAPHPMDPEMLFLGTGKGIFKSEDGGAHWLEWFEESTGLPSAPIVDILIHPENPELIFAASPMGLYVSEDEGESWAQGFDGKGYESALDVRAITISANNPNVLYLATANGAYRSKDLGKTWTSTWEKVGKDVRQIVSLKTEPEFLYVGSEQGLFKSFNRGISWVADQAFKERKIESIWVDPKDLSHLIVSWEFGVQITRNGGDQWKGLSIDPKDNVESESALPHSIKIKSTEWYSSDPPLYWVATDSGLLVSMEDGATWKHMDLGSQGLEGQAREERTMDLVKLFTEIHTGRFFGSYIYLLVDLATIGLLFLVLSGFVITYQRNKAKRIKKNIQKKSLDTDMIMEIQETTEDLFHESTEIHDMIEHIGQHLEKCKSIYLKNEKKEIQEIGKHIHTLDKKMHHLLSRLEEFDKMSQN